VEVVADIVVGAAEPEACWACRKGFVAVAVADSDAADKTQVVAVFGQVRGFVVEA